MDIGQKKKTTAAPAKTKAPPVKGKSAKATKQAKSTKASPSAFGKKSKKARVSIDEDDEVITASKSSDGSGEVAEEQAPKGPPVQKVPAFVGGFVNPVLEHAVNSHWNKSIEITLLGGLIEDALIYDGVFIGDIAIKSSFVKRSGGNVLL